MECLSSFGGIGTWLPLNIATTAIDFPAFVLTLSGAILLFFAPDRRSLRLWELAAACLCLGIAAAVRGPMMFGGVVMILLRVAMIAERRWLAGLTAATLFLLPILVDLSLQRTFGVINNGVMALFCIYSDPTHTWSPACNEAFLAAAPAKGEVLGGYLRFMFSAAGVEIFGDRFLRRIAQDAAILQQGTVYALLLVAGLLVALTSDERAGAAEDVAQRPGVLRRVRRLWQFLSRVLPALLIVGSLLLVQRVVAAWSTAAAAWVLLALAATAAAGYWRAMLCLSGYLAGTLFLVLSGLSALERLPATYSFLLYLGAALAVAETVRPSDLPTASVGRWPVPITWVVLSAVAFLYGGDYLSSATSSLRRTYLEEVHGHPATAMKLSDDARIDRSLYYTGDRTPVYTRYDGLPIGTVRKYRRLAEESNVSNSSFLTPNAFLE